MAGKIWTAADDVIMRQQYPKTRTSKLATVLGRSERAVYCRAITLSIRKDDEYLKSPESGRLLKEQSRGPDTCFKKGQRAWNKGIKGLQIGGKETQFKAGHLPHNTKEDFAISIRTDKTGITYKYIRTSLAKWIPFHRYVWEQKNGIIPKGLKLIFKDKNTMNCNIENLELVTAGELMKRNSVHNYPKQIAQSIQLRGALNRQINKHLKRLK